MPLVSLCWRPSLVLLLVPAAVRLAAVPDLFAKEVMLIQDSCLLCGDLGHVRSEVLILGGEEAPADGTQKQRNGDCHKSRRFTRNHTQALDKTGLS